MPPRRPRKRPLAGTVLVLLVAAFACYLLGKWLTSIYGPDQAQWVSYLGYGLETLGAAAALAGLTLLGVLVARPAGKR